MNLEILAQLSTLAVINFEVVAQLGTLALIVLAGPLVIILLAANKGNL